MVAYRLANLFRRLFGEGNMQAGFVPQFESMQGENPKEALLFYRDASFSLLAYLFGGVVLIEGVLWGCGAFLEPGWAAISRLAMWMVPGLIFICLYALNSAFLQCQKSYFAPAVAPVLFNFAWIAAAVFGARFSLEEAAFILSCAVVGAFAVQWAMTALQVRKKLAAHLTWREWFQPRLFSPEWKKLLKPLTLGIAGIGAMQINSALDAIFARMADLSGPAYLWFAVRIQQLPLALFGIALSGALLPPLARAMREGSLTRYHHLLDGALRYSAALMVPCAFGLLALGRYGLNLLYGHGQFQPNDVQETLYCLWGYAIGLIPAVFILILATGFYARKSYSIPALASIVSVVFNVLFNAWMVFGFQLGVVSIAIGTSLAACLNCLILGVALHREIGMPPFAGYLARLFVSGSVATAVTFLFSPQGLTRSLFDQFVQFGIAALLYASSYIGAAYLLKARDLFDLFKRPETENPRA